MRKKHRNKNDPVKDTRDRIGKVQFLERSGNDDRKRLLKTILNWKRIESVCFRPLEG
jgi:CelD/BcsL family acetyltransferase involved in cellulose biosynthesis